MTSLLLDTETADAHAMPSARGRPAMIVSDSSAPVGATSVNPTRSLRRGSSLSIAAQSRAIRNVRTMRVLDRIAARFEESGVPLMALKGAVLNMTVYDRPDQRPMDDLDLLIHESDIKRAFALLEDLGGVSSETLVHGDFFPRFQYEMEYTVGHIYPVRIDLHVRPFRPLRYGRVVPTEALWASARRMRIDQGTILIPSDEEMLIHLAAHAAIHACARRSWLVDLRRWVARRRDAIDWQRFVDTADRWRLTLPVREALVRAERELGPFLPADVLPSLVQKKVTWRDRLALRQAPRDAERPVMHVLVSALTTPGWLFVLGYLRRILIPGRAHMADWYGRRHWGWLPIAHLLRWLRPLLSRVAVKKRRNVETEVSTFRRFPRRAKGRRTDMSIELQTVPAPQRWFARASQRPPRRRSDVQEQELDHEVVLFDPVSSRAYRFNKTAFSVWCQCDGTTPVDRIGRTMSELYDTDYVVALDHVEQLVTVFAQTGLLERETIP